MNSLEKHPATWLTGAEGGESAFFGYSTVFSGPADRHQPADTACDLLIDVDWEAPPIPELPCRLETSLRLPGRSVVYRAESDAPGNVVLRFSGLGAFHLTPARILVASAPGADPDLISWLLFGVVAGLWLEMRGHVVLHGAVVQDGDRAIAMLGDGGAGKSTLCAALARLGLTVLSDDHVVLDARMASYVRPGLPWIKMSAEALSRLRVRGSRVRSIHPTALKKAVFLPQPKPGLVRLGGVVLLDRQSGSDHTTISKTALSALDGFGQLVALAYSPRSVWMLGYQSRRLSVLRSLTAEVPIHRLSYPSGWAALPRVGEFVKSLLK